MKNPERQFLYIFSTHAYLIVKKQSDNNNTESSQPWEDIKLQKTVIVLVPVLTI